MDEELDKNFEIRNFNASFSVSAIVFCSNQFSVNIIITLHRIKINPAIQFCTIFNNTEIGLMKIMKALN